MTKPCPFCGEHHTLVQRRYRVGQPIRYSYACWNYNCDVMPKMKTEFNTAEEAAACWNRREDA